MNEESFDRRSRHLLSLSFSPSKQQAAPLIFAISFFSFFISFFSFFFLSLSLSFLVFIMPSFPKISAAVCSALVAATGTVAGASELDSPAGNWSLVTLHDAATGPEHAVCLDGSPYAFYTRPSITNASDKSKWVVFMEGGGWCGSDANCAQRALTPLGSSTSYGPDPGPTEADVLFNDFPDAVAVYAKYCDGGSWTGNVTEPITVGRQQIWYRGRPLLDALLDELLQQGTTLIGPFMFSLKPFARH